MKGICLLVMLLAAPAAEVAPSVDVPGVFEAKFSWRRGSASGAEPVSRLVARVKLHDRLDRKRLLFRVDDIDMRPLLFNVGGADASSSRTLEIEIPSGHTIVEVAVFAVGEKEAVHRRRFETAMPRTRVLGGPPVKSMPRRARVRHFPPDEIPPDIPSVALPPERNR